METAELDCLSLKLFSSFDQTFPDLNPEAALLSLDFKVERRISV